MFLISVWYLLFNQAKIVTDIITAPFNLSWVNLFKFFLNEQWLDVLIKNFKTILINLSIVISAQLLFFIIGIVLILVLQWKSSKATKWYFGNKLIFAGYLFMLVSTISLAGILGNVSYQLVDTINSSLQKLSVAELTKLSDEVTGVVSQFTWSLDSIISDATTLMNTVKHIIATTKEIANIPDLITVWFDNLTIYRNYLLGFVGASTVVIISGHLVELYRIFELNKHLIRKNKKVSVDERIITLLEQQQKLLEKLSEKEES
ncbi:hypothetical protein IV76_GL002316 [Carnobacterium maltaromaticum]|nr:hypothetical protein IV76_GL002316 [Carnobacterium maltaromaticum]